LPGGVEALFCAELFGYGRVQICNVQKRSGKDESSIVWAVQREVLVM